MGQAVHVDLVGSLLGLPSHVHSLLGGDELDQLVAVLAHNDGPAGGRIRNIEKDRVALPEVTGHVVPGHAVAVLVVQHGQAGLVVELLQALDGDADVVLGVDGPVLDALEVVRLPLALLAGVAPVGLPGGGAVGGRDPGVARARPEPPVDVDGGEVGGVAALVLEVALAAAGVHRAHVV